MGKCGKGTGSFGEFPRGQGTHRPRLWPERKALS